MHLADFQSLLTRIADNRDLMNAGIAAVPRGATGHWYTFSSLSRSEHGAQGITEITDNNWQDLHTPLGDAPMSQKIATTIIAGVVPPDYLFPETREQVKDLYRSLCAARGDSTKAEEQLADTRAVQEQVDASRDSEIAELARLAEQIGEPMPVIDTDFYARMTRAEFDAAVQAGVLLHDAVQELQRAASSDVSGDWKSVREQIRDDLSISSLVDLGRAVQGGPSTAALDVEFLDARLVDAGRVFVSAVPFGFLVEETREEFVATYRSRWQDMIAAATQEQDEAERRHQAEMLARKQDRYASLAEHWGLSPAPQHSH